MGYKFSVAAKLRGPGEKKYTTQINRIRLYVIFG